MGGKLQHSDVVWLVVQGVCVANCNIATGVALLGVAAVMWLIMQGVGGKLQHSDVVWLVVQGVCVANCNIATGVVLLGVAAVMWLIMQGVGGKLQHSHWRCAARGC